jgi:hypothetical protein
MITTQNKEKNGKNMDLALSLIFLQQWQKVGKTLDLEPNALIKDSKVQLKVPCNNASVMMIAVTTHSTEEAAVDPLGSPVIYHLLISNMPWFLEC